MNRTSREAVAIPGKRALRAIVVMYAALSAAAALGQPFTGKQVHVAKARNLPFCEIVPFTGKLRDRVGHIYNTTGASDCPPAKFNAIDPKKLAEELHADTVFLNPRRNWVFDQIWAHVVGETRDFDGVKATWMATMSGEDLEARLKGSFNPFEIHSETTYLYAKGKPVFLMRTPDGKTYVMQSYTNHKDKSLSLKNLSEVGSKLTLPSGWKFEVKKLDRDLTIDPLKVKGVAHIIQDNLENTYEGCGFDAACNYIP